MEAPDLAGLDPATPSGASALLGAYRVTPRKRWGQSFLVDRNVLHRIADLAAIQPHERVLEIGAGLGALTRCLAQRASHVTTVEVDARLEPILRSAMEGIPNASLIMADFLRLDTAQLLKEAFLCGLGAVVANIPYSITTPILERLLSHKRLISRMVLLMQQEVADRLAAHPGTDAYGSMSVFAQYHARVEILGTVPPSVFLPRPEVSSSIVRLTPILPGAVAVADEDLFFQVVRCAFGQRRKTLANALRRLLPNLDAPRVAEVFLKAQLDAGRRGETLGLEEFAQLASAVNAVHGTNRDLSPGQ
ncbi:MAG: 16S rRNA (adenine(1518)-N(6)/adenine(1519)-N(6))-dimethyltransferase RsmA [Chthonomonadales bacterium]